jgi:hypothetical protein
MPGSFWVSKSNSILMCGVIGGGVGSFHETQCIGHSENIFN